MRPVTGPPQTGTYIQEPLDAHGKYTTVNSDGSKFGVTADPKDATKARVFRYL